MNIILNQVWRLSSVSIAAVLFFSMLLQTNADSNLVSESQAGQQTPPAATTPAANPADVASMDSTIASLYDVISGPAGKKRDWNRFRSLFIPGARLIPTGKRQTGETVSTVVDPEGYMTRSSKV